MKDFNMSKKIKYQGKTYILESSLDQVIKEKLTSKIENSLDDVLGNKTKEATPNALDETVDNEDIGDSLPTDNGEDIKIEGAIEAVKTSLGLSNISEDNLSMLRMTLGDIISDEQPISTDEAPDTILHEGIIFRKVGKVSNMSSMMESANRNPPKQIKVKGKIFTLCESK